MSGRFWEARAIALSAEHGVQILAPDLPSHGQSAMVAQFDYANAANRIAATLEPHAPRIDLLVGASSGGIVALKLAARLAKPVAAIGVGARFSAQNVTDMAASARELPQGTAAFIDAFLEAGAPQRRAIQRHFGDLAELGEAPLLETLECAALVAKTLIINGAADDFFLPDSAHELAASIPQSLLTFVTRAGHLEPLAPAYRDFTWASIAAFARTRPA